VASIAKAIDDSSADNLLYFIIAGPTEVPVPGIRKSKIEMTGARRIVSASM
jgi:hypothetical protein